MDTSVGPPDRHDPVDVLVKLYELPPLDQAPLEAAGIRIRRPIGPEKHVVTAWVGAHFGPTGVVEPARGQGVGAALLLLTLQAMREQG